MATARKMVTIAVHMLKNKEPYRYALPRATEDKLAGLRVRDRSQEEERRRQGLEGGSQAGSRPEPHDPGIGRGIRTPGIAGETAVRRRREPDDSQ